MKSKLVQKGFEVNMKNSPLSMYDANHKLIIKVPLSKNRTFQININTAGVRYLKAIESMNKFGYGMPYLAI